MRLKRFSLKPQTCFKMGILACAAGFVAAMLGVFRFGQASMLLAVQYALMGAMLLFLAACERGVDDGGLRVRLIVLFCCSIFSFLGLPPLSELAGMLIIPVLYLLYKKRYSLKMPMFFICLAAEAVYAVLHFFAVVAMAAEEEGTYIGFLAGFSGSGRWPEFAALLLLSVVRFFTIYCMYRASIGYMQKHFASYEQKPKNILRK